MFTGSESDTPAPGPYSHSRIPIPTPCVCRPHIEVNKNVFDIWKEKHFCRKFPQSYVRKNHVKVHGKANGHSCSNILMGFCFIKTSCLRRRLPFHAFQPAFSWK